MEVVQYDSHANPTRIDRKDGRTTSYLWDKSGLNPLCSITNATNTGRAIFESHEREWADSVYRIDIVECLVGPVSLEFKSTGYGSCHIQMEEQEGYDWYIAGTLDGRPFEMANQGSSLPEDGQWISYLNREYYLNVFLPAGRHEIVIDHLYYRNDGLSVISEFELVCYYPLEIDTVEYAGRNEFLYENFEDIESSNVITSGYDSDHAYQGEYHVHMIGNSSRSYILDYRVKRNGIWEYVRMPLTSRDHDINEGSDPIDDVRVWPVDSQIETYNWYPYVGLRSRTGSDGVTESYQYDDFSRLCSVKDDSGNIIRTFSYHYQDDNDPGNRLETSILRNPGVFEFDSADSLASTSKNRVVKHYDGLGFPIQEIQIGAADGTHDIVTHHEYDAYMRESRKYLPYVDMLNSGNHFRTHAADSTIAFYSSDSLEGLDDTTMYPYAETVFENSLLDRVLEQGAPGETWQPATSRSATAGRTTATSFKISRPNGFDDRVRIWTVCGDDLVSDDYYRGGGLKGIVTKDENWESGATGTLESYVDNDEKIILERRWSEDGSGQTLRLDTYYVYDDLGRLRFVLPPLLSDALSNGGTFSEDNTDVSKYAFIYKYNDRGDCIYKKLPGAEPVRMRYDSYHRLACVQDGNLAESGKYVFNYYDAMGRNVISGISSHPFAGNPSNPECLAWYTGDGPVFGYELQSPLPSDAMINKVDYYDSYDFIGLAPASARDSLAANFNVTRYGHGRKTGSVRWTIGDNRVPLYSSFYYDEKGNPAASHSMNILGGWETEKTSYSFTGVPTQRVLLHSVADGPSFTEHYSYNYDNMDRLVEIRHRINDGNDVVLTENTYNQLGQLINVRRNNCDSLATSYTYNIRGWMTSAVSPTFSEMLYYNNLRNGIGSNTPCYNGNISAMDWCVSRDSLRGYDYRYDPLDRLIRADYLENGVRMTNFDCEYSYDAHGNILTSSRNGLLRNGQYGNLGTTTMIYNGNQLTSYISRIPIDSIDPIDPYPGLITPQPDRPIHPGHLFPSDPQPCEFAYDANGNLLCDPVNGISGIVYNELNLPWYFTNDDGMDFAAYIYDSDGNRLQLDYSDEEANTITVNWCGNLVYVNGELDKILFDGGFIRNGEYYFFATDHLGSIRAVTDSQGNILQTTHYYPYGEEFADSSSSLDFQPYKFTGKEDQSYAGIPMTYFGARFLAHPYSQWTSIDPLAEKYYSLSPYNYCGGNPVAFVDPDGKDAEDRVKYARDYSGKEYAQETGKLRYENTSVALEKMDCSELVTRVMMNDGLLPVGSDHDSSRLNKELSNDDVYTKSDSPIVGDVALWEGHAGIVTAVDNNGNFKLMHARGVGKLSKENSNFASVSDYRKSSFIGFFHPRSEDNSTQTITTNIVYTSSTTLPPIIVVPKEELPNLNLPKYVTR